MFPTKRRIFPRQPTASLIEPLVVSIDLSTFFELSGARPIAVKCIADNFRRKIEIT